MFLDGIMANGKLMKSSSDTTVYSSENMINRTKVLSNNLMLNLNKIPEEGDSFECQSQKSNTQSSEIFDSLYTKLDDNNINKDKTDTLLNSQNDELKKNQMERTVLQNIDPDDIDLLNYNGNQTENTNSLLGLNTFRRDDSTTGRN